MREPALTEAEEVAIEEARRRAAKDPWADNERVARERIRADARRPLGVNLAEGLAHSEFLLSFCGVLNRH